MTEKQFLTWQKDNPTFLMAHKDFLSKESGYSPVGVYKYRWVSYEFKNMVFSSDNNKTWRLLSTVIF